MRPVCRANKPCHLHVLIVLKSGSLNFLEPSGPVKACNGSALHLTIYCDYTLEKHLCWTVNGKALLRGCVDTKGRHITDTVFRK
jgi:hypothetical protein